MAEESNLNSAAINKSVSNFRLNPPPQFKMLKPEGQKRVIDMVKSKAKIAAQNKE